MFRKNYLTIFLTIALFLIGGLAVSAQNAPIRGKVELKKADGKTEPLADALVEVYRVDIKSTFPSAKTDKKGFFNFVALPLGANYVLVISAPNTTPVIQGGIKAGMENVLILVDPGDGKRYTEEEVRAGLANQGGNNQVGEMTADQKKQQEEYNKKVAEVTEKNKKIEASTQIINAAVKEGGVAYDSKNYDLAIAKFDEGYKADPDFAGTAPVMLNNKALALIGRGSDSYNKSVKATDDASKAALKQSAKNDFIEVLTATDKALEILKAATSTEPNVQKNYETNKFLALTNRKNAYRLLAQTGLDREKGKEALVAFQEYLAVETDPAKKSKAQLDLALTLQDSNEFNSAVTEFQKILETDPNNVDALAGVGLSLVTVGYTTMDTDPAKGKAQLQEAANYLQKFVDLAPDTHKYKDDAKTAITTLRDDQKLTPQKVKTTTTTKKKN